MNWGEIVNALEYFKVPGIIVAITLGLFFGTQIILLVLEAKGKIVLEWANVKRRAQKKKCKQQEQEDLLKEVKTLLSDVNARYSEDNIAKRNDWIGDVNTDRNWMHERANTYDQSIVDIKNSLLEAANQLQANTKMVEDMFIETSRDRIIDFSERASNYDCLLSREQFRRINRVYDDYEEFLKQRKRQNGEIDTAYELIQDGYKHRLQHRSFVEDMRDNNR